MTNLSDWPEDFERGLPDAEGFYACIVNYAQYDSFGRATFAIELVDIQEFGKLAADELGIEPGLCACDAEGCVYNINDYGIVGYHRICDNSYDITTADGFKGVNRFLKLNGAGIDFYLKWYRRELEKIRVKEWPDADIPPAPPLMPPMPVFSRSFFVDAENE